MPIEARRMNTSARAAITTTNHDMATAIPNYRVQATHSRIMRATPLVNRTPMFQISGAKPERLRFQIHPAIGLPRSPKAEGHLLSCRTTAGRWGIVSVGETDSPCTVLDFHVLWLPWSRGDLSVTSECRYPLANKSPDLGCKLCMGNVSACACVQRCSMM